MIQIPTLHQLKFAVGYDCNRRCGFCLQQNSDHQPILDFAIVEKIFQEEMVARDVNLVTLTGGEPTFGRYLPLTLRIISHISQLGKQSCIFTNGDFLDENALSVFRQAGATRFRVSLYDPIDWDSTGRLIKTLKSFGYPAMFKYTVTKESYDNLLQILIRFGESEIEWFQIKPYNRTEIPAQDKLYEMSPYQVLSMARMLLDFRKQYPRIKVDLLPLCYEFLVDETLDIGDLSLCHCGKGSRGYLVIGPTGDIRICGAYPDPIGNAQTDSITELWQNHPLLQQVRGLASRPKPQECAGCAHWKKCAATDCHSATFARYGNFAHGNPQCPLLAQ